MNAKLLDTFLSEDGDARAREKLLNTIREQRTTGTPLVREFNFNRFNVTLNFEAKQVFLQDDLTVGPEGEHSVGMEEFEKKLERSE